MNIPRAAARIATLTALLPAAAAAQSVSLPLGPAFDLVSRQLPDLARADKRTSQPPLKTWMDRGLRLTDEVDETRADEDTALKMMLIVRRPGDEAAAVAAAAKVLGPALSLHIDERRNCVTIDEYLLYVAKSVRTLEETTKKHITVDYGTLREKVRADLKGVKGSLYILHGPDPS